MRRATREPRVLRRRLRQRVPPLLTTRRAPLRATRKLREPRVVRRRKLRKARTARRRKRARRRRNRRRKRARIELRAEKSNPKPRSG